MQWRVRGGRRPRSRERADSRERERERSSLLLLLLLLSHPPIVAPPRALTLCASSTTPSLAAFGMFICERDPTAQPPKARAGAVSERRGEGSKGKKRKQKKTKTKGKKWRSSRRRCRLFCFLLLFQPRPPRQAAAAAGAATASRKEFASSPRWLSIKKALSLLLEREQKERGEKQRVREKPSLSLVPRPLSITST